MLVNNFLEQSNAKFCAKTALVCGRNRCSYGEIETWANRLAHYLIRRGLDRRDRVAVYLENSVEAAVSIFGILKAGGVFLVINPQVKSPRLSYILNDCNVKVLITSQRLFSASAEALERCGDLSHIIIVGLTIDYRPRHESVTWTIGSYADAIRDGTDGIPPNRSIDIDLAALIYTSGSTGNPKGIMLTHLNIAAAANSITSYLENTSDDIVFSCLPLSFDYGLYQLLMTFKFGGTLILERSFTYPYYILELIAKERVTGFPLLPAIAAILLRMKNIDEIELPHLRYITNTAQAMPVKNILRLTEIFPDTRIFSMYGLTECKRVSYLPHSELTRRPGSVGKAMPNTEAWIVDENGSAISEPWKIGELVVRGANVMKGYWNLPEETKKRLKQGILPGEYILYTGDLFQADEDGYLYFVARRDNMIKTGGEMVSPKEVETVLDNLPDVIESAVVAEDDEILGKSIKAFVVVDSGSALTENEVIRHCSKNLEGYKVPKTVDIRFVPFPKTSSGKIAVRQL